MALLIGLVSLAADAHAQSFGGSQRGTQRSGGTGGAPGGNRSGSSGGFNIQVGPGGVQFGAGNNPQNSNVPNQPGSPSGGFNNNPNNNPNNFNNNRNNWNNNGNNWNNNPNNSNGNNWNGNNWNRSGRPGVIIQPAPVIGVVPSLPTPPAEPILLINPANTQTSVHYRVNQYSYVLAPGQTQQLDGSTAWTIDYHRGGDFGRQSYGLTPGRAYRFTPGTRGWDLFVVQPEAPPVISQ